MPDQTIVYVTRSIPNVETEALAEGCDIEVWDGKLPPEKDHIVEKLSELEADGFLCLPTISTPR